MPRPRLIINCATNDLELFRRTAEAVTPLGDRYELRMVVSHLSKRNTAELVDPGDPYLQYSVNFPGLFQFNPPGALESFCDRSFIEANRALLARKMDILRKVGLKGAFFGREPVYLPERVYQAHPQWRGPRVDHPRRSRNPVYSPCLHRPEIRELYRESVERLVSSHPDLDTFYWWTNDSGAGFCWYPHLYAGPNGPEACRAAGTVPALAAFQSAVLQGANEGGAKQPICVMLHTRVWDQQQMPNGAYRYPSSDAEPTVLSVRPDLSSTYPIRHLEDPLYRLEQFAAHAGAEPVAVIWWLSDIYHRSHPEPSAVGRLVKLWDLGLSHPSAARRLPGRLSLLADLAAAEFGPAAADDVLDGWINLHEAFRLQMNSPYPRPIMTYLPMYGPVSHRWLTRPLVAFPNELTTGEEDYFLPHVFAMGAEARRQPLDLHGYPIADPREDHTMRSAYFERIASCFEAAADHFEAGSAKVQGNAAPGLRTMAKAARLMACLWKTIRNWFEYAVLRAQGGPAGGAGPIASPANHRNRMYQVLRREIDNVLRFQELLGDDPEKTVVRAASADEEDTFALAPDLHSQLTKKRRIMLARWMDVERLWPGM